MNLNEIKSIDDAQRYVNGVINDYEGGISTKEETLSFLGEYTARIMEIFTENVKANPSLLGLTPTSPKEEQTPMGVVEMAEEIYNDKVAHWFNGQIGSSDIKEDVLEAMYEYASQFNGKEAVEFAEWIKEYRWVSTSDGIKWMDLFGNVKTSQELYTLFLNTKTKQHEHTNIKS